MTPVSARAGSDELARQIEFVGNNAIVNGMLATIGCLMAVLNEQRQVLAVNDRFLRLLGSDDPARLLGLWPGEVLGCATTADGRTPCGSGKVCETCGAAIVIATALATDGPVERKCVLTALKGGRTVDLCLQVRGVTIHLDGERFVLVFMQDITEQELATALQRAFFHDIRNIVMGLGSTVELLANREGAVPPHLLDKVVRLTGRLVREVKIQGSLAVDSFGDIDVRPVELTAGQLVEEIHESFSCHPAARGKRLGVELRTAGGRLVSDPALVVRVLGNMIINAFEATPPGGEILLRVEGTDGTVAFRVWNAGFIPEEVGVRIFQHFYSTKEGPGRGLGTYSMKVFGEKLLGGRVGFTSIPEEGTWFCLELPRGEVTPYQILP
jgi:hypothetical protein